MRDRTFLKIVIPTFNRAERLSALLGRVAEVASNPDLEIVVVDDFSYATQREGVREIAMQYDAITFLYLEKNYGGGGARNRGAFSGEADWIWFIDDDDAVTGSTILGVLEVLRKGPKEKLILLKARFHVGDDVREVVPQGLDLYKRYSRFGHEVNTSCAVFKFDTFKEIGGWDSSLVSGQDTDIFLRFSEHTDAFIVAQYSVDILHHVEARITTNPKKQIIGKAQFIIRNWRRLHIIRLSRYVFTLVTLYPYLKKIISK